MATNKNPNAPVVATVRKPATPRTAPATIAAPPSPDAQPIAEQTPPRRLSMAEMLAAARGAAIAPPVVASKAARAGSRGCHAWEPDTETRAALAPLGWEIRRVDNFVKLPKQYKNSLQQPIPTQPKTEHNAIPVSILQQIAHGLGGAIPSMANGEGLPVAVIATVIAANLESFGESNYIESLGKTLAALGRATGRNVYRFKDEIWLTDSDEKPLSIRTVA